MSDAHSLDTLIQSLRRLPGVGVRSAQRMAFHLLQHDREGAQLLARSLQDAVANVRHCALCHTFTEGEVCDTCLDERRDATKLCVVETPADQAALERTAAFKGRYFVLMGRLSPLDGIGPRDIGVQRLIERACDGVVREVILATNPSMEGDATALYLRQQLLALGVRVTRLARGLPVGGDLEYADQHTLLRALAGRQEMT